MIPETEAQQRTLDAIRTVVAREGRAATLREIAQITDTTISTVWHHVLRLSQQGLTRKGKRGCLPAANGEDRYVKGRLDAVGHLRPELDRILTAWHAHPGLIRDVREALECAERGAKG